MGAVVFFSLYTVLFFFLKFAVICVFWCLFDFVCVFAGLVLVMCLCFFGSEFGFYFLNLDLIWT